MIPVASLIDDRPQISPKIQRAIKRASEITGQRAIRFPKPWEDTVTMAAQSAKYCFDRHTHLDYEHVRHITVGTETSVDHSKPVAAYVQGMLRKAGFPLPGNISTFQVQHACAAGTLGLLSVSALLGHSPVPTESGIVLCSDIARYEAESTAEVTQGSGAVTLLVEQEADLVELDIEHQGYSSQDVDDFFRPLDSVTPQVYGRFSMQCFETSLFEAFNDHCRRKGRTPAETLQETDFFVLHTPFHNMPLLAMQSLLAGHLGYNETQARQFCDDHGTTAAVEYTACIGNLYSGAMYLALAVLLKDRYAMLGEKIAGKKIIMASYGSGNIMIVVSGTISPQAPRVIETWNLADLLKNAKQAPIDEYLSWINSSYPPPAGSQFIKDPAQVPAGRFYLKDLRDDGYREYEYKPQA